MSLPRFTFTDRARPWLQIGVGDNRTTALGRWDVSRWDAADARWSGIEPTWLDVSCEAFRCRCEYGRRRSTDRFVPGVATVEVSNASGWADPLATSDPADLTMRPGRAIRFGVDHDALGRVVLWRGFIDSVTPTYDPMVTDSATFQCVDALGDVNRARFAEQADSPEQTASQRIEALLQLAAWPPDRTRIDPSSTVLVPDAMNGQLADLLGRAADSAGGSVFGDRDGFVVFRGRDWQTFPPGTPYTATIGNVDLDGEPGYTVPGADGYLTPSVGVASSTPPGAAITADTTITFDCTVTPAATTQYLGSVWNASAASRSWLVYVEASGALFVGLQVDAAADYRQVASAAAMAALGTGRVQFGVRLQPSTGRLAAIYRTAAGTWAEFGTPVTRAPFVGAAGTDPVRIGARGDGATSTRWAGRVWAAERRAGLDPTTGALAWRFAANDYPGTGTSYVDPRGRTWTLTTEGAITPQAPAIEVPAVPPDVCPVSWERPFARADIATRAIMGRDRETAVVVDDTDGVTLYGIEPHERIDLWTRDEGDLLTLADRALRVLGHLNAPVVRSATLDAGTSDGALDVMTTADPYAPTHYRCRLAYDRGLVFDAVHLVTGLVHDMTADRWETAVNLDLAEPFVAVGGRWDQGWWDLTAWADIAALRAEALALLARTGATA